MTAEALIQDASNRLADYSANAANASDAAVNMALQMVNAVNAKLPLWNGSALPSPGTVPVDDAPAMFTETYRDPGTPGSAPDVLAIMQTAFNTSDAPARQAVDAAMAGFMQVYCPTYHANLAQLQSLLSVGAGAGTVLEQSDLRALVTRMESELDDQRRAAQRKILKAPANGHETPLFMQARLDMVEQGFSDQLAKARSEIVVQALQITLDMRKFCLGALDSLIENTRSVFLQYAGMVVQLRQSALAYGQTAGELGGKTYELELSAFEGQRKAALAVLESAIERNKAQVEIYKTRLSALVEAKGMEYKGLMVSLEKLKIPYEGELKRNLAQAEIDLNSRAKAVDAYNQMANVRGEIAQSLASGINAIASQSISE